MTPLTEAQKALARVAAIEKVIVDIRQIQEHCYQLDIAWSFNTDLDQLDKILRHAKVYAFDEVQREKKA